MASLTDSRERKRAYQAAWRQDNVERMAAYREANRERRINQGRAYREANRDLLLAKAKAYAAANREAVLARKKAHREANAEAIRKYSMAYRQANRARLRANQKAREQAHPDKCRERFHRRVALKRQAVGADYTTAALIQARFEYYGYRCRWCGTADATTADHVIALSLGGAHLPANIVPSCKSCNSRKQNKPLARWLRELAA